MDTKAVDKPLAAFRDAVSQDIAVDEMIVFGSYLEGTPTRESDIDVVVVSNDFKRMSEDERLRLLDKAAGKIKPVIEAWGFTRAEIAKADRLSTLGHAREEGLRFA